MGSIYDRALLEVGNDGKFQRNFDLIYNVIFACLWSMAYNNIILALTVIPHTCKLPPKPENVAEDVWKDKYIPRLDARGIEKYSECLIYTNDGLNETKFCSVFDYDTTWFETTIPSENNWVCQNDINVSNVFFYSRITELIGSLVFGWFGDVYGRKLTFIISLLLLIIGRFITVAASSSLLFITIGLCVAWFPSWSATQSAAVISSEISSPQRRATIEKLKLVFTSFGMFLMSFFYWWLRSWKSFLIITTAPQLIFLIFSWRLIESPQWLWINGKSNLTVKSLKQIAKVNKTSLRSDTESEILTTTTLNTKRTEELGAFALFSSKRIAITTTLQLCIWFASSLNYGIGMLTSVDNANINPFLSFAWQALAEIPGYFIGAWLANKIGRRYTGMVAFSLTTTIWIIQGIRGTSNTGWLNNEILSTLLVVVNRCSITVSYYIINLLNMELYPTCLRQSGMSLGNVSSSAASSVASYILTLGRTVDVRYQSAILTVTTLLGGILPIFLLPETLNKKLPATLEDAKNF